MSNDAQSTNSSVYRLRRWRKSTFSGTSECIEITALSNSIIAMRDSKDPDGGAIPLTSATFAALIEGIKAGELDRLVRLLN